MPPLREARNPFISQQNQILLDQERDIPARNQPQVEAGMAHGEASFTREARPPRGNQEKASQSPRSIHKEERDELCVSSCQKKESEMSLANQLHWKVEGDYDYSSTQVNIEASLAEKIMDWGKDTIPDEDLFTEGDNTGREDTPHITILYGVVAQKPDEVAELLSEESAPIKATLGKVSLFDNDDYDVVKIDVDSDDLHRLHDLLADNVEHESSFPEYKPHVTIAYVKKGSGKLYSGSDEFEGTEISFDEVRFSSKDEEVTMIALKKSVAARLSWRV